MKTLIANGTIINEDKIQKVNILIENDIIKEITTNQITAEHIIDAEGKFIIPGIIDDQVHFREPGLTWKCDIADGSRCAAAGGVTSYMEMPNVKPPTTTVDLLKEKQLLAAQKSYVNYSFYIGATNDNLNEILKADPQTTCGVKVFMGSSTGNMLVDNIDNLERIFALSPMLIATHCEDTPTINANLAHYKSLYGDAIPPECHPLIRSREACFKSSSLAASLARKHNSRLHILHLSTAEEIALLDRGNLADKHITGEVCVHHLWFNEQSYKTKGNLVRWNPAIKTETDRRALIKAFDERTLDVIATDHAPHIIEEKSGLYTAAASGGPMIQHSLSVMLELVERGETTLENVVYGMCHAPALLFQIEKRGFIRPGYKADLCIFKKEPWQVSKENILYKCGWSPLEGQSFSYKVDTTFVNGQIVYQNGNINEQTRGELLRFNR